MDINRHTIEGYLGDDPKHFADPNKTEMAAFSIATTLRFKNGSGTDVDETEWHRIVAFGWRASIAKDFRKGDRVFIEGYSRTRPYQKNGQDIYIREVVAQHLHLITKPPKSSPDNQSGQQQNVPVSQVGSTQSPESSATEGAFY